MTETRNEPTAVEIMDFLYKRLPQTFNLFKKKKKTKKRNTAVCVKHNKVKRNKAGYVYIKTPLTGSSVFILKQPVVRDRV